MKVYIDCGAYDGTSIIEFRESKSIFIPRADALDYKVIAFEPNEHRMVRNVELHRKAIWIYDASLEFQSAPETLSSRVEGFPMFGRSKTISVPCINFSQFIKNLEADYLVVKMDVEHSEYVVLPHLIETGMIHKINELYVEYHGKKHHLAEINNIERNLPPGLKYFNNWP